MSFVAPIAALAAAIAQPAIEHVGLQTAGAVAQALATVRIVSGTAIRFDQNGHFQAGGSDDSRPSLRTTVTLNGTQVPAAIAEFQ